jgi:hypothetical protein
MRVEQSTWRKNKGWIDESPGKLSTDQWVLTFGSREILQALDQILNIRETYPKAVIVGCSTAGEISGQRVFDDALVITAVEFENTIEKLHLQPFVEDEMDSVCGVLGKDTSMTGFYSYGDICPAVSNASCNLHNQIMTITTFTEN